MNLADAENHLLEENTSADLPPEVYEDLQSFDLVGEVQAIKISVCFIIRIGLDGASLVGSLVLSVTGLPEGYSLSDVVYKSEDTSVATVDSNGNISAKADGVTSINASVGKGMISITCAVIVTSNKII